MFYHASPVKGLTQLEPRISNHGIPLVYFSRKRKNVLVYLSNAVEKYCRETGFCHGRDRTSVLAATCWAKRSNRKKTYYGFTTIHQSNHNIMYKTRVCLYKI